MEVDFMDYGKLLDSHTKQIIKITVACRDWFEKHIQEYDFRVWGRAHKASDGNFIFTDSKDEYNIVLSYIKEEGSYYVTAKPTERNKETEITSVYTYNSIIQDFCVCYLEEYSKMYQNDIISCKTV